MIAGEIELYWRRGESMARSIESMLFVGKLVFEVGVILVRERRTRPPRFLARAIRSASIRAASSWAAFYASSRFYSSYRLNSAYLYRMRRSLAA